MGNPHSINFHIIFRNKRNEKKIECSAMSKYLTSMGLPLCLIYVNKEKIFEELKTE